MMGKKSYSNTAVIFVLLGFYFFLVFFEFFEQTASCCGFAQVNLLQVHNLCCRCLTGKCYIEGKLVVRNFKVEIDLRKEIFFWFFLNFECVFGFLLVFEQKHVLRHKCAVLLFFLRSSEVFEIWFFCSLNLILTFQCIPDCDKLLINLIMSYCLKL